MASLTQKTHSEFVEGLALASLKSNHKKVWLDGELKKLPVSGRAFERAYTAMKYMLGKLPKLRKELESMNLASYRAYGFITGAKNFYNKDYCIVEIRMKFTGEPFIVDAERVMSVGYSGKLEKAFAEADRYGGIDIGTAEYSGLKNKMKPLVQNFDSDIVLVSLGNFMKGPLVQQQLIPAGHFGYADPDTMISLKKFL